MDFVPALEHDSEVPLYRQLFDQFSTRIRAGELPRGSRLPATRELAGLLGLNRTTVSAAYEMLESEGLITGQVGRGSFVSGRAAITGGVRWDSLLEPLPPQARTPRPGVVSFVVSRPARDLFPLADFRAACEAVLGRADLADILQLGSPSGYPPLRRYLLEEARRTGLAAPDDDLIITNGCQQALDLIGRVLLRPGDLVVVEDPIYTGLRTLLTGMGVRLAGIPVDADGIEIDALEAVLGAHPARLIVVTPNFQNPTGATLPQARRRALLAAAHTAGVPVVENDAYGGLRYRGEPVPAIKELDAHGGTVLLRSFSKVSFPGLRVGWALGPKPLVERLRLAKESTDLHTDQLAQAALLEFAVSGRLEAHRAHVLASGAECLDATLAGCARWLPAGSSWTQPEGGMNVWVRLPAPLDAAALQARAEDEGVAYVPGKNFAVDSPRLGALRLSFAGLSPAEIGRGLEILGRVAAEALDGTAQGGDPASAMV